MDSIAAAAEDSRVRVLRFDPNVGPFENPCRLLGEARGVYVKFLMHDRDNVREALTLMTPTQAPMIDFKHLSPEELATARQEALKLEDHAYHTNLVYIEADPAGRFDHGTNVSEG